MVAAPLPEPRHAPAFPCILYFNSDRKLVSQQRDVPPCSAGDRCPAYPSDAPARFVLELNAGDAARLKLENGAQMNFGRGIRVTP